MSPATDMIFFTLGICHQVWSNSCSCLTSSHLNTEVKQHWPWIVLDGRLLWNSRCSWNGSWYWYCLEVSGRSQSSPQLVVTKLNVCPWLSHTKGYNERQWGTKKRFSDLWKIWKPLRRPVPDDDLVLQVVDLSILVAVLLKRFSLTDYLRWNDPSLELEGQGKYLGLHWIRPGSWSLFLKQARVPRSNVLKVSSSSLN